MDTEQYEEAVRDYETVYQTEKTPGEQLILVFLNYFLRGLFHILTRFYICPSRTQTPAEDGAAGAEEEQEERLLQSFGSGQERHRRRDQKGLPQAGPDAPPG